MSHSVLMTTVVPMSLSVGEKLAEVRYALDGDAPEQFLWKGRVHRVCVVLGHHTHGQVERWRVRAAPGKDAVPAVFHLHLDWSVGRWEVVPAVPDGLEAE